MGMGRRLGYLLLGILIVFMLVPFLPLLLSSFSAGWRWPDILPETWTLRGWGYVFSSHAGTWKAVSNSVLISFAVTLLNLLVALPAGHALGRLSFKGKRVIEGLLLAPLIVPPFVSVMGLHMMFIRWELTETMLGVILAHVVPSFPYMVRALTISFHTLGSDWEQQGAVLGAGRWQRFRYIIFPHILPGIVAGASLSILVSLSQYLLTFLVGGGQVITLPLILFPFVNGGDPAVGAAYTWIFVGMAVVALGVMNGVLTSYYNRKERSLLHSNPNKRG